MIAACMLKCTWSSCADFVLWVLDGIDLESSCRYRTSSLGRQNKQPCHSGVGVCLLSGFYDFPFPCGIQWAPRLQRWIEMGVDSFVFWSSGSRIRVFLLRLLAEDLENACTRLMTPAMFSSWVCCSCNPVSLPILSPFTWASRSLLFLYVVRGLARGFSRIFEPHLGSPCGFLFNSI